MPRTAEYNCLYSGDSSWLGRLHMVIVEYRVHQLLIPPDSVEQSQKV